MNDTYVMLIELGIRRNVGLPEVIKLCMVFGLGLIFPLLALAMVVMAPRRRAMRNKSGAEEQPLGLGETSLQDEFWQFIEDVERGRVAKDEVAMAVATVVTHRAARDASEPLDGEGEGNNGTTETKPASP